MEHKSARAVEGFKNSNAMRRGCCRDDRKTTKQNGKQRQCQSARAPGRQGKQYWLLRLDDLSGTTRDPQRRQQ
jgi:hypothetical protein